ncbi:zinc ribbon domain-containing protein [Natrinema gelatinilyticum]|uniref:zinc ribbon domain-containing protein n=1 Tax=Natrinema gelatinilyticum TaxID=2961571 RepID=UPI003CE52655
MRVREHSCPSCWFTTDRDWNAAWNILSRGIKKVGTGCPESPSAETSLPIGTTAVLATHVWTPLSPPLRSSVGGLCHPKWENKF